MTKKIVIPVDAPAIARGVGFFETALVIRGNPVFLEDHYARIESGVASIGLPAPTKRQFVAAARRAIKPFIGLDESSVRLSWLAIGQQIEAPKAWKLYALGAPIPSATLLRRRRGRVVLLDSHLGRTSPELKSVSYIPSVLGLREAVKLGADEALFTNEKGKILEGTTSNVFAIRGNKLYTPPVSAGLLPGIMRKWVVEHAEEVGLDVRERLLTNHDLLQGSFITGSLTTIVRIRSIDGKKCADPGTSLRELQRIFRREIRPG